MSTMLILLLVMGLVEASDAPDPLITSPVGTGKAGFSGDGGPADQAQLNLPFDVAFDGEGNLYFSDTFNHRIRRVDAESGEINTVAGNGRTGFSGDGGPATKASLNEPYGVGLDAQNNLYFVDRLNRRVRRVEAQTGMITTVAGNGTAESFGDGGPAAQAGLVEPNGIALNPSETTLYIADVAGHRLRAVELGSGTIRTVAGTGEPTHSGDDGPAIEAGLHGPRAVDVDDQGFVFVLERNGNTLRKIDPNTGVITTIAGTGEQGYSGDGGPATEATMDGPKELDVTPRAILIVDTENHVIRRINRQTGRIDTIAGTGEQGGGGDGGSATQAQLDRPHGVAESPGGAIVIGDTGNHRIRRLAPANHQ